MKLFLFAGMNPMESQHSKNQLSHIKYILKFFPQTFKVYIQKIITSITSLRIPGLNDLLSRVYFRSYILCMHFPEQKLAKMIIYNLTFKMKHGIKHVTKYYGKLIERYLMSKTTHPK